METGLCQVSRLIHSVISMDTASSHTFSPCPIKFSTELSLAEPFKLLSAESQHITNHEHRMLSYRDEIDKRMQYPGSIGATGTAEQQAYTTCKGQHTIFK